MSIGTLFANTIARIRTVNPWIAGPIVAAFVGGVILRLTGKDVKIGAWISRKLSDLHHWQAGKYAVSEDWFNARDRKRAEASVKRGEKRAAKRDERKAKRDERQANRQAKHDQRKAEKQAKRESKKAA